MPMYAIVETGGKQYRVKPGDTIAVERLSGEPGEVLDLGRVLLLANVGETRVGSPALDSAIVRAEVVEHARGEKIVVFRYKSKVRYRRKTGHRQSLTRLRITDILLDGSSAAGAGAVPQPEPEPRPEPALDPAPAPVAIAEAEPVAVADMPTSAAESAPAAEAPGPAPEETEEE
jgi:large subunit ribosomal protein L21